MPLYSCFKHTFSNLSIALDVPVIGDVHIVSSSPCFDRTHDVLIASLDGVIACA